MATKNDGIVVTNLEKEQYKSEDDDELDWLNEDLSDRSIDVLIPDGCDCELTGVEQFFRSFNLRYEGSLITYLDTLQNALHTVFNSTESYERRSFLIYVHHDQSVYTHIFCKQLLCHQTIFDYLSKNYMVWAWDVTYPSNAKMLSKILASVFADECNIAEYPAEDYPLLLGVYYDKINLRYHFQRIIDGSNDTPGLNRFRDRLIEFRDQFENELKACINQETLADVLRDQENALKFYEKCCVPETDNHHQSDYSETEFNSDNIGIGCKNDIVRPCDESSRLNNEATLTSENPETQQQK